MRYTLRMLATQQFERASFLTCALEFLRSTDEALGLGQEDITIGLWLGNSTTPNQPNELTQRNGRFQQFLRNEVTNNPFPVTYCPWCGCTLYNGNANHGYHNLGTLQCINPSCHFHRHNLPISYIDECIYHTPPTLLFSTVDKFALVYREDAARLLRRGNGYRSPDLIIQDELHLISGALGSMVGLFESVVEEMIATGGRRPKIVASTATTRNTSELVQKLYHREVRVFPAQGLDYSDNYFSHVEKDALRRHIGIMPIGKNTSNAVEIRLAATLVLSRIKLALNYLREYGIDPNDLEAVIGALYQDGNLPPILDLYWSIVLYFNSLKDLGRSNSRTSQEVYETLRTQLRKMTDYPQLKFLIEGFDKRKTEFTSREDSARIRPLMTRAETPTRLHQEENHRLRVSMDSLDLIYASNMISVGIDISRWNMMLMVGQPRSAAEYIQSSSRVARSHSGVVINLLNPFRIREFSLFENYTSFHNAYYRYVEPLSITPLTSEMLRQNIMNNMIRCYRAYVFPHDEIEVVNGEIVERLSERFQADEYLIGEIEGTVEEYVEGNNYASSLRYVSPDCWVNIAQRI